MKKRNLLILFIPLLSLLLILIISLITGMGYHPEYSGPFHVKYVSYDSHTDIDVAYERSSGAKHLPGQISIHYPVSDDYLKFTAGKMLNNISGFSLMLSNLQGLNWINFSIKAYNKHASHQSILRPGITGFPVIIIPSEIPWLNTSKVMMVKELCSHGFVTVSCDFLESGHDQQVAVIDDIVSCLESIRISDPENGGIMDLSQIGILMDCIEEISLISHTNDQAIKAIAGCDDGSGQIRLLHSTDPIQTQLIHAGKNRKGLFHGTRIYMKITKFFWQGTTENMGKYKFSERPLTKSLIKIVDKISERTRSRKIRSQQDQLVSYFENKLYEKESLASHEGNSCLHEKGGLLPGDSSNFSGWFNVINK